MFLKKKMLFSWKYLILLLHRIYSEDSYCKLINDKCYVMFIYIYIYIHAYKKKFDIYIYIIYAQNWKELEISDCKVIVIIMVRWGRHDEIFCSDVIDCTMMTQLSDCSNWIMGHCFPKLTFKIFFFFFFFFIFQINFKISFYL